MHHASWLFACPAGRPLAVDRLVAALEAGGARCDQDAIAALLVGDELGRYLEGVRDAHKLAGAAP